MAKVGKAPARKLPSRVALLRSVATSTAVETRESVRALEKNSPSAKSASRTSSWPAEAIVAGRTHRQQNATAHGRIVACNPCVDRSNVAILVSLPSAAIQ
ncbi:MAG: hypothetical protein NAOJABEB_02044 [Steroidobacteraceae bacterium]|nr:hypothetical protein [Steroidobacteraceae bacterium]